MFSPSFLIFWGQGFVEVPQLLKSVSSFTYRIVNRILRFVSRYVSNRSIVYRYTPNYYKPYFTNKSVKIPLNFLLGKNVHLTNMAAEKKEGE